MTVISAVVFTIDRQGNHYRVVVQIGLPKYRGSFNTLVFGENKPFVGSFHDGRLGLVYHQDPGIHEGQEFPLWTIQ